MSKYNLNTLATKLAEKSGVSQTEAELFIRKMFDVCHQGLETDKQVKVRWLGTFKVTAVKDRESVDVNTGERILIEGRDKISFTPDNILKEIVNKPFAQFETVVVSDGVDFDSIDRKFELESEKDVLVSEEDSASEDKVEDYQEEKEGFSMEASNDCSIEEKELASETLSEDLSLSSSSSEHSAVSVESSTKTSGVIDFLEAPSMPMSNSDVVVVGNTKPSEVEQVEATVNSTSSRYEELEESQQRNHFVLPKYVVAIACVVVLGLVAGISWFAFSYGQMVAERDHLAIELNQYRIQTKTAKNKVAKKTALADEHDLILSEKARQDSLRMVQASEALKSVENQDAQQEKVNKQLAEQKLQKQDNQDGNSKSSLKVQQKQEGRANDKSVDVSSYDSDPRVRTGAYRIVGVAQVVKVSGGQSLSTISSRYLGPGMECYVEALNGIKSVKDGQKIKIPKLELKKKK